MLDLAEARNPFTGPPWRSKILRPGLPVFPPGFERYTVNGGGFVAVDIEADDEITVVDLEGGQLCEIAAAGLDGRADAAIIGATADPARGRSLGLTAGAPRSARPARQARAP